jgi:hypothetical protein
MVKGRLIGGVICLVLAVLLVVLIFALPEGKVVFMIGNSNVPWVPALVLAGLGAWLVSTAWRRQGA